MEFDKVVVGEIDTDVDVCYKCCDTIEHDHVQFIHIETNLSRRLCVDCGEDAFGHMSDEQRKKWKIIEYVLNEWDK